MTATKDIINVAQAMNAAALARANYKLATKKKKTSKDFLETGFTNITGSALLQANAQFISGL